jgi:hypothetical protein
MIRNFEATQDGELSTQNSNNKPGKFDTANPAYIPTTFVFVPWCS